MVKVQKTIRLSNSLDCTHQVSLASSSASTFLKNKRKTSRHKSTLTWTLYACKLAELHSQPFTNISHQYKLMALKRLARLCEVRCGCLNKWWYGVWLEWIKQASGPQSTSTAHPHMTSAFNKTSRDTALTQIHFICFFRKEMDWEVSEVRGSEKPANQCLWRETEPKRNFHSRLTEKKYVTVLQN